MFKKRFFVLSMALLLSLLFSTIALGEDGQQPPTRIVFRYHQYLLAEHFTPFGEITFSFYASPETSEPFAVMVKDADEYGGAGISEWEHTFELVPGKYVEVSDGILTKALVLEGVTFDVFDPDDDVLSGTAPPNRDLLIYVQNESSDCRMTVSTGDAGAWTADFSDPFCDVLPGMWGAAAVTDEDEDVSEAGVPQPPIGFHDYEEGTMEPWNCKAGGWAIDPDNPYQDVNIRVLVDGKVVGGDILAANYRPDLETAWGENGGGCPYGTCAFDVDLNGLITPFEEHKITVEAQDLQDGGWHPLYHTPKSLTCESYARIEAFAWFDRYSLADWPAGIPVTVAITNPDYSAEPFTPDSSQGWYDFFPGVDLHPGSVIVASNGAITKQLVISPLHATVNPTTGTVTGIASSGATFHMRTDGDHFQLPIEQDITADSEGMWYVTIGQYLPWEWFTRGEMWEGDADGDVTYAIWHVRNELVEVWLSHNEIRAFDWPLNTELKITVEDPETGDVYKYSAWTEPLSWMEGTGAVVNAGDLQLVPGMKVTVSDGKVKTSTKIQDIKITAIDIANDVVYGTAPQKALLELASWEDSPVFRFFTAGRKGNWAVDYKVPSLNGVTVDLNPGDELRLFMREKDKDSTVWGTNVPNPRIVASEAGSWFWTIEFYPGMLDWWIYASADANAELLGSGQVEADQNGFAYVALDWDLDPGNYLVVSDEVNAKGLVLESITMSIFGTKNEIMAGTTTPGREVWAAAGPQDWQQRILAPADQVSGAWLADFKTIEFDITEEMRPSSYAHIYDEDGDANEANTPPSPHFTVFPEWEWFDGLEWPDGAIVSITVDGKPECAVTVVSPENYFNGSFGENCDLEIGDMVTFEDETTIRTHVVRNLAVALASSKDDIVGGTADPGTEVFVWPHETGQQLPVITGLDGSWQVDFTDMYDLTPGKAGRAEIRDEMGNATAVDWNVPKPWLVAYPDFEAVEGWEWPAGAIVQLTINNAPPGFIREGTAEVTSWGDPRTYVRFEFGDEYNLKAGDEVTLSSGGVTISHVVRNLSVTVADPKEDIVAGTTDPGVEVFVWPHETGEQLSTIADTEGNWQVDFTGLFDLIPGTGGRAEIRDEMGYATAVDWNAPKPWMIAFPENDAVEGWEWPEGAEVTLTINNAPGLAWYGIAQVTTWGDPRTYVRFDFGSDYNLSVGDEVTLTSGGISVSHVVQYLTITSVDEAVNTVSGEATDGTEVQVWPHGYDQVATVKVTAGENDWTADFNSVSFDLVKGMGGRSQVLDEFGNATAVDWHIPKPTIVASITENWFYLQEFTPGATLDLSIFESQDGALIWSNGERTADSSGFAWINFEEHGWDLEPGNYLVVSDGNTTKTLIIGGFTFDLFDLPQGLLQGTAPGSPGGRLVWVGIGWENAPGWSMEVFTDPSGNWVADFDQPVSADYWWVAAQIFDEDGDASELRPAVIIGY